MCLYVCMPVDMYVIKNDEKSPLGAPASLTARLLCPPDGLPRSPQTLFSQMDAQAARAPSAGSSLGRRLLEGGSLSEEGGGPPVAKSTRVAAENYVLVTHGLLMRVFCMSAVLSSR